MEDLERALEKLERAYRRLLEILEYSPEEYDFVIDATIQRFEFTFELAWKTVQRFARFMGAGDCAGGRSCIKLAYKLGWITDAERWLELLEARNLTSHTYDDGTAKAVYTTIAKDYTLFGELIKTLKHLLEEYSEFDK